MDNASTCTTANTTSGPTGQESLLVNQGVSILKALSAEYKTKLNTHVEDVALLTMLASRKTSSDNEAHASASSVECVRESLFKTIQDAILTAKNSNHLEEHITRNRDRIDRNVTSKESNLKKWLHSVLQALGQQTPAQTGGLDEQLQNIRVILSERFLAKESEGRMWKQPPSMRESSRKIFGLQRGDADVDRYDDEGRGCETKRGYLRHAGASVDG